MSYDVEDKTTIINDHMQTLENNKKEIQKMKNYCGIIEDENKDLRLQNEELNHKEIDTERILDNETIMKQIITKST